MKKREQVMNKFKIKTLGGITSQFLLVNQTQVRFTLEIAAPVFHGGLTLEQTRLIGEKEIQTPIEKMLQYISYGQNKWPLLREKNNNVKMDIFLCIFVPHHPRRRLSPLGPQKIRGGQVTCNL